MRRARCAGAASAQDHSWHVHCFIEVKETSTAADIKRTMTALAPDLSQYWLPASVAGAITADVARRDADPVAAALVRELEALVERVNAARCIF